MHIQPIVILAVLTYLINGHSVLGDPDPAKNGNAKRQESRNRGETKFLLTKPTVKNKKYQVTTTGSPVQIAGPSRTTSRRPAKKSAPMKLNPSEEANQQIQRFPSLASLVYIQDLPVVYPTKTTTTTTTTTSRRPPPSPTASLKRAPTTPYRKSTSTQKPRTTKRVKNLVSDYSCPKPEMVPFRWFPLPCDSHKQCTKSMGKNYRCCEINSNSFKTCTKGIVKQIPEQKHTPLFGVPVKCPKVPLAELFWNVQACETDNDCWPRVCCPDGRKKFCRSPNPEFKDAKTPFARQLMQPFQSATSFIQCTAPSPFDVHPMPCNSTLECFPNLCCQEGAKRHCRPPKRSLFSMVANSVSQTLFGH